MEIFTRAPENCASFFNLFVKVVLIHILTILTVLVLAMIGVHNGVLNMLLGFLLLGLGVGSLTLQGLLAYQIGFHPVVAVLWALLMFVPFVNLIALLLVWFKAKKFLRANGYKIVLMGAERDLGRLV